MPRNTGSTDHTNRVVIEPAITRAFWSRRRAWNGTEVKLVIETRHVPDDTPVAVALYEDDAGEGSSDDFIEDVAGDHKIRGNRCTIDYTLRFDHALLGEKGEGDELEFYFVARVARFTLDRRSNLLYVDLGPLYFSG